MENDLHSIRERIAHAIYIDSRGTMLSPEFIERQWDGGHVVRDEFYRRADAAMAVVAPALDEVKAQAWDEGFTRGFYDPLAGADRDASESDAANPYRKGN